MNSVVKCVGRFHAFPQDFEKCVEGGVLEPILDQSPIKSIRVLWSLKAANFAKY